MAITTLVKRIPPGPEGSRGGTKRVNGDTMFQQMVNQARKEEAEKARYPENKREDFLKGEPR